MSSLVLDSHWVSAQKILEKGYLFSFPLVEEAMQDVVTKKR
jgi:NAD dependent epimerase/dehydratase family enzyme